MTMTNPLIYLTTFILIFNSVTVNAIYPLDIHSSNETKFNCPDVSTCSCIYVYGDYELHCPVANPLIILRVNPKMRVQIDCATTNEKDYLILPELNIGDIPTVQFSRCPVPKTQPFVSILNRLGIKKVYAFFFSNRDSNSGMTLIRQHFQGLNDLDRLYLSGNGLSELPEDLFYDVTKLRWLDLQRNKVHLPPNIFKKLENLEFLELGFNNLQSFEPGIFRNQKKLSLLNLWGNNLQNLTKEPFEGLVSLANLDLSVCGIQTLQPDVFTHLVNLTNINLSANKIQTLPPGLFTYNNNLKYFKLMNNRVNMESIPDDLFINQTSLMEVTISAGLLEIPGSCFEGAVNIQNLSLSKNEFKTLPSEIFTDLGKLQQLDLSDNKLTTIDGVLESTSNLIVLRLSNNKLENISRTTFQNLINLKELYMNNNNLKIIHQNAFVQTKRLEIIRLENNFLKLINSRIDEIAGDEFFNFINSPFQNLEQLRILNLRNNSIETIFRDWTLTTTQLRDLDLSYNHISIISYTDLQFLSRDIVVNLTHNNIVQIQLSDLEANSRGADPKQIYNSVEVSIDNNPLMCDCMIMYLVKYLLNKLPEISKKIITIDPGELKCAGPPKLAGRSVSSLRLEELLCPLDSGSSIKLCPNHCECNVRTIDSSIIIDCSNRNLTKVPTLPIPADNRLEYIELHVENNNLTHLPLGDTPGYSSVREIYANNNYISYIGIENIPKNLTILQIANNNITFMNTTLLHALNHTSSLKSLSLSANKWKCDCPSLPFLIFVQNKQKIIDDYLQIVCRNGEQIAELGPGDFCPEDHTTVIALAIVVALLGVIIGLLAAIYYKYNQEIKVWLFAHQLCLWFVTEEELDKDKKYDAFISYSHKDEEFITDHLVPNLEKGPYPFKLCLHIRDWVVGEWIPTQIAKSVEESRRTIVVLSPNFLESVWGRMEFRTAHNNALTEGRARVIVIIYGDIGNISTLDPELKAYLNMNTYVKWGDPWFWDKLRYAMPHPPGIRKSKGLIKNGLKSSVDDKLELIIPTSATPPLTTPPAENASQNPLITKLNGSINHSNDKIANGINGHVNGAFIINTNSKQSDV